MKSTSITIVHFILLLIINSDGLATSGENDSDKSRDNTYQSKVLSLRKEGNAIHGKESTSDSQVNLNLLSSSQKEEVDTSRLSFIQSTPAGYSEHWGINQEQVDYLFENSSEFITIGVGDRFKKVNKKFQEATGWSEAELTKVPFTFFLHPDDLQKHPECVEIAQEKLPTWGFESRYRCKDNSYLWTQWISLAKLTTDLKASKDQEFFNIGRDITEKKKQEAAKLETLETQQKEIKNLYNSLEGQNKILRSICAIQSTYYIERENLSFQESSSEDNSFLIYYKTFKLILEHFIELSKSEYGFIGALFYDEDHQPFVQQVFAGKIKDAIIDERLQQILGMYEGKGKKLCNFNNILGDIITTQKPMIINDVKSYSKPTGIPQGHLPINSFLGLPFMFNNNLIGIVALANGCEKYSNDLVQWLDPLSLITARIMNELKLENWRKEAEQQNLARKQAEAATAAKSVFLAHMSHEIRTPLTGILGLIDLINKESLSEEDCTYLQTAQMSGWSLMSLLNDILDISKIEAHQIKLEKIKLDPAKIVQEVIKLLSLEAKKQKTSLTTTINPGVPLFLIGDPTRLRQIFFNLIGNAIKFTKNGSVSVSLDGKVDSVVSNIFCLKGIVTDTGIGMTPETLQHLFQPFSQADASMMRQFGGTGLGLYITKKLCKVMNGDIKACSQFGAGSSFEFTVKMELPAEQDPTASHLKSEKSKTLPKLHVLIAEDNPVNQLVLKTILNREGCSTTVVENGLEAVEATERESFDLVLMDGEMPVMDGLEATRRIRKSFNQKALPIIGVTGHALDFHRERFLASGMNGYLTKPIKRDILKAEILRCLKEKADTME